MTATLISIFRTINALNGLSPIVFGLLHSMNRFQVLTQSQSYKYLFSLNIIFILWYICFCVYVFAVRFKLIFASLCGVATLSASSLPSFYCGMRLCGYSYSWFECVGDHVHLWLGNTCERLSDVLADCITIHSIIIIFGLVFALFSIGKVEFVVRYANNKTVNDLG